jgi:hypothetical protein
MKSLMSIVLTGLCLMAFVDAGASQKPPYIGGWSNGRGETLLLTATTLTFGKDKPVRYKDVTKVTDNRRFAIQLLGNKKLNYFTKFLVFEVDGKEMKLTLYNTYEDLFNGKSEQGNSTWYR